jgi:hypothetical protein
MYQPSNPASSANATRNAAPKAFETIQELLNKERELKGLVAEHFNTHEILDKETVIQWMDHLSNSAYSSLYKKIKPLGFSPSLMLDAEKTPKEKRRVGTFLALLFENAALDQKSFESL